jgi:hypothetical protein
MAQEPEDPNKADVKDYVAVHPSYKNAANETDAPLYADDEERELYEKFGHGPKVEIVGEKKDGDEEALALATATGTPELQEKPSAEDEHDNPSKPGGKSDDKSDDKDDDKAPASPPPPPAAKATDAKK